MKILYIDNKQYHHNSDLHPMFFSYMHSKKYHRVHSYGKYMGKYFDIFTEPSKTPDKELHKLVNKIKPDIIITYNCNGSSYELGLDNVNLYKWCEDFLASTNIPKFHFSTDWCRNGFRQEQADWFKNLNYTASFFRHKVSLKYEIGIPKYWVPFSIDKKLYEIYSRPTIKSKNTKVGFIGAAHNSSKELYASRVAAIDYLLEKKKLEITKITNQEKFTRKLLFGKDYIEFLTKNLFGLTCGGTCNYMTAKYFQIPAAYSMLVCTKTEGLDIFPKDTYLTYDKDHLDALYEEIVYYEKNLKEAKEKIYRLHNYVVDNHSHHNRILELTDLIKRYI